MNDAYKYVFYNIKANLVTQGRSFIVRSMYLCCHAVLLSLDDIWRFGNETGTQKKA